MKSLGVKLGVSRARAERGFLAGGTSTDEGRVLLEALKELTEGETTA